MSDGKSSMTIIKAEKGERALPGRRGRGGRDIILNGVVRKVSGEERALSKIQKRVRERCIQGRHLRKSLQGRE